MRFKVNNKYVVDAKSHDDAIRVIKMLDAMETYSIRWIDTYAKSQGYGSDFWRYDAEIKANNVKEALEKLAKMVALGGTGTANCLVMHVSNSHATYQFSGRLSDLLKKTKEQLGDSIETEHEDERQTEMAIRFAVKEGKNQHGYYEYQGNADVAQVRRVLKRLGYHDKGYNKNPAGMMNRLTFYFADSVKEQLGDSVKDRTVMGLGKFPYEYWLKNNDDKWFLAAFSKTKYNRSQIEALRKENMLKNGKLPDYQEKIDDSFRDARTISPWALSRGKRILSEDGDKATVVSVKGNRRNGYDVVVKLDDGSTDEWYYMPDDVITLTDSINDAEPDTDVDLDFLIKDEFEAIDGYRKMIAKTSNPQLLSVLSHILDEETEHVEELRAAQAGVYEVKDSIKDGRASPDTELDRAHIDYDDYDEPTRGTHYFEFGNKSDAEEAKRYLSAKGYNPGNVKTKRDGSDTYYVLQFRE